MTTTRNLPSLVRSRFKAAQEAGDLIFYATRVSTLQCGGSLTFQLRFSPALANKPKSNKLSNSKQFDPFENPSKGLFISELPPSHNLILNKFPVIPDHFLLATKEFKEQTHLLEEGDLGAAYECLKAYKENGEELFGFFNSGEHSGASQPHRHIQFLPVESMRSGIDESVEWSVLVDQLLQDPKPVLPFACFFSALPAKPSPKQLHSIYTSLYIKALQLIQQSDSKTDIPTQLKNQSVISYNLGITDRIMVLCPRTSEGTKFANINGDLVGPIALNGTLLGGTLLAKSEEEWNALLYDETKLESVLQAIGIPYNTFQHEEHL